MNQEDRADIDAERGYSEVGARELRLREWFATHEPGEKAGDFERLVRVLRARKWEQEHPERKRELKRLWARRPDVKPKLVAHVKRWRHARCRRRVETCAGPGCVVQWCRVPFGRMHGNGRPKFCSKLCRNRARYRRAKARV